MNEKHEKPLIRLHLIKSPRGILLSSEAAVDKKDLWAVSALDIFMSYISSCGSSCKIV